VLVKHLLVLSVPIFLTVGTFAATWWYVVVYNAPDVVATDRRSGEDGGRGHGTGGVRAVAARPPTTSLKKSGSPVKRRTGRAAPTRMGRRQEVTSFADRATSSSGKIPAHFYAWFWASPPCPSCCCSCTSGEWTESSSKS